MVGKGGLATQSRVGKFCSISNPSPPPLGLLRSKRLSGGPEWTWLHLLEPQSPRCHMGFPCQCHRIHLRLRDKPWRMLGELSPTALGPRDWGMWL